MSMVPSEETLPGGPRHPRSGFRAASFLLKLSLALAASNFLPPAEEARAQPAPAPALAEPAPTPLLDAAHPADWLFVYKINASTFDTHGKVTQ